MSTLSLTGVKGKSVRPRRLLIKCDREHNHLVKMASFGTATWLKSERGFSCPLEPVIARRIIDVLPGIEVEPEVNSWAEGLYQSQVTALASTNDSSPLTDKPLVPFQMASVRFLATVKRAIMGHEMGTGKTPISCVALDYVNAAKVLIVCPNSVKWSWVDHLRLWGSERKLYVLESTAAPDGDLGATIISGTRDRRDDALSKVLTQQSECVILLNYTQLRMHSKSLAAYDYDVVIADEAHRVSNRKAQQTEAFHKVTLNAEYVWMLTGTPVRNNYADLYAMFSVCDPTRFGSYWNFIKIHMQSVPGIYGGVEIIGLRDPAGFNSILSTFMYRVTKKDAMPHLPEKLYLDYRLTMLPEQHKLYRQMEEEFLITIEKELADGETLKNIIRAPNVAAQLIRLRQICLTPEILEGPSSSAKIEALRDLLEDLDGRFIIFTCFRRFLPFVKNLLHELGVPFGEIVGGQSSVERAGVEKALNDGKIRGIIGTIQSMGEGLNLQAASTAIFCDVDWVPAVNAQAEDRIHRGGITESPTIIRLFHPGTVEADIRSTCARKSKIIEETTGQVEVIRQMLLRRGR